MAIVEETEFEQEIQNIDENISSESTKMSEEMTISTLTDTDNEVMEDMESNFKGNKLEIGSAETKQLVEKVSSTVDSDLIDDSKLTKDFENKVTDKILPEKNELLEEDMPEKVTQASEKISGLKIKEESVELNNKSPKYSKLKMIGKIAMYGAGIIMGLDWVAGKMAGIVEACIHSDDTPAWAKNMTKEQKEELTHVSGALPKLSILVKSWMKEWEQYKDRNVDFGKMTVTVNSTTHDVPVMYMLFYGFTDMNEVVKNTQEILAPGISELTIADVTVAANNIFVVLADSLAIFNLRDHSKALKTLNFPPINDKATVQKIIITFKDGRKKVTAVGVKYTRFAIANTIKTYLQVKITEEIYQGLQDVVLPAMQAAAKQAYKDAAQSHMDKEKHAIRALAFVPGAGIELAQEKLHSEQKEAAKLGTEAAQKAALDKLRELRPQVVSTARLKIKKYASADQAQLKAIASLAIDSAMGQVKGAVSSSK